MPVSASSSSISARIGASRPAYFRIRLAVPSSNATRRLEVAVAVSRDGLLAGAGGELPGDRAIDVRRRAAARRWRGRRPMSSVSRASRTPAASKAPSRSIARTMSPVSRPSCPYGNVSRSTTSTAWSATRSPSATIDRVPRLVERVRADGLDRDPLPRQDLELGVASDDLERLADLARDVVADLRRVGDVVEVAATGVGHRLEQRLVEVVADAEGRRRHAAGAQLRRRGGRARRGR